MVLEYTSLKNQKFLAAFNPQTQQSDVILREIVYLLLTTKEIVRVIRETVGVEQKGVEDQFGDELVE